MQNKSEASTASSENAKPREKANRGFYKRRRGILEHIEDGTIDLLESGIHDYLSLKANLVIGNGYKLPAGVVSTSAPAIHACCKYVSERTIRRILNHLEEIGWIKRWQTNGKRGNYMVLICRATVHDLSGNEYRVNGEATTDWSDPVYEPVRDLSADSPRSVHELSGLREVREEKKEEAEEPATPSSSNQTKTNTKTPEGKSRKVLKEAWEAIGIPLGGSTKFILVWERFYAERPEGEKLSDTMEDCIQWCQANGIKPTPPFYEAKRLVKAREAEDDSEKRRPFGGSPFPPELMR